MDELFGVSMTLIMWVLLGILGVALSAVAYVVLRSRVMFLIGLRNMPRRVAQTTLEPISNRSGLTSEALAEWLRNPRDEWRRPDPSPGTPPPDDSPIFPPDVVPPS